MKHIKNNIPDVLILVACILVSTGVFMIYVPGGFITAGISCAALGVLINRKGDG